jgi:hypothetical protein
MSKIEKQIQNAQSWRKKHSAETLDFKKLDGALSLWEQQMKKVEEAKARVHQAKEEVLAAQKAVTAALKEAKAGRKPVKPVPEPKVKKEKKSLPETK